MNQNGDRICLDNYFGHVEIVPVYAVRGGKNVVGYKVRDIGYDGMVRSEKLLPNVES